MRRKREVARVRKATNRIRERMQKAREARANRGRAWGLGVEGVHVPKVDWEKEAGKALNKIEGSLVDIFTKDCAKTAERFGAAATTAGGVGFYLQAGGPVAQAVGVMLGTLAAGSGIAAGIFYGASELGLC